MRIAYVCYWDAFAVGGVPTKIDSQSGAWREAGHEVTVFCLSPSGRQGQRPVMPATLFQFRTLPGRALATIRLRRAVARYEPDLIYLRYDMWIPPLGSLLRRFTTVVELNTDDRRELELRRLRARLYNRYNRRAVLGSAAGIVCVTRDLARLNAGLGKPVAVVTNAVTLDAAPTGPPPAAARPRAVFLAGTDDPWQGVDKVLFLARAIPEWDFVLVGVDAGALTAPPSANLTVHGTMTRPEYGELLARSDIGLGTLALHRKGLEEATPLKVREYLAHGLPTVIAYEDTDFAGLDPWFLLRLPNEDSNVRDNVHAIRAFGDRVRGRRVGRDEVAPLIGRDAREAQRLAFMAEAVAGRSGAR